MKRLFSLVLTLCLILGLAVSALAAGDLTVSKNTHLPYLVNAYDTVTVKSGATLSMENWRPDAPGLEIGRSLVVESGGAVTGGSLIFERGATSTGIDLYYRVAGREKLLAVTLADLIAKEPQADYRPTFLYDLTSGHYVLVSNYEVDPFEAPQPGGGGAGGTEAFTLRCAEGLKALGLMEGVGENADGSTNFALQRTPTRVEAIVLLIRLLGKNAEAVAYPAEKCPFVDVDPWARSYIAYAYDTGLTNGVSRDRLGTGSATVQQFQTFVLRAMGYSDANGADFTWDHPETLAENLGIVLSPEDVSGFNRGTCVRVMEIALRNATKDGVTLADRLIEQGVFTRDAYEAVRTTLSAG